MSCAGSVTGWLDQLQGGDALAVEHLWERYFRRLLVLARQRMPAELRQAGNDEDVALDAFASFVRGAQQGQFQQLMNRDNLWRLLIVITARKVCHLLRAEGRRPVVRGLALEQVLEEGLTPELQAQAEEECRRLLRKLGSPVLESVARWRMEGHTTREIADRLQCAPRTVERKVFLIQRLWADEVES